MVLVYNILERERRDLTVWCKVEYFADGNTFTIDVPSFNPPTDEKVHEDVFNAGVAYQNQLLDKERIDREVLPSLG